MKVNILLSTYNGARFLAQQIESIQAQTYADWQLLIRDDGSSDDTRTVIAAFVAKDSRIRWVNPDEERNLGVIKSFYSLVKHEPADVYFFSDQDDVWLPDKLAVTLSQVKQEDMTKPLLVYTDLKVVNQELTVLHKSMIATQSHHANTELQQELTENTVTGGTMMINHALAELWQTADDLLMHDWYLALVASSMGKLVYVDQATQLYRQHDSNVLGARTWRKRMKNWLRPQVLVAKYWWLIKSSQAQATKLLALPLPQDKKAIVDAYIGLMNQPLRQRWATLRRYGFAKNRWFHTLVFTTLILTKFGYLSEKRDESI
ncbi:glycosyltransferase family 2 protein [Streptococcus entericus]|uniref:glycosyltransferase family 2 protein n=1 Tax=Streptococcus entericus TaxID=155680 RepID=UPI0003730AA7|nr:glycosyltransferase family 2 protein [Streptococcus entericus]